MTDSVEALRRNRKSPAVLKTLIINVRSREKFKPIFVFEGADDVGPYCAWIGRCNNSITFEPLPANGKDQVLLCRHNLSSSDDALRTGVYFFVDRDFDDLKGFEKGSDIFMTEAYSIENYLVSKQVFESILVDEFKCAGESIDCALSLFSSIMGTFFEVMSEPNQRIFFARRLSIAMKGGIEEQIKKYVTIELEAVKVLASKDVLKLLIPLEREPSPKEVASLTLEFVELEPALRHRGKFVLAFFYKWLELLADERIKPKQKIFTYSLRPHFSAQQLSMRSLATRSDLPRGLADFIGQVNSNLVTP